MTEVSEHVLDQQDGEQLLLLMTGAMRALEPYDVNNDTVQRLLGQMTGIVNGNAERGNRGIVLLVEGENFFVHQTLLRLELKSFQRMSRLRETLDRLGMNEIEFRAGANPASLSLFFQRLSAATGDAESVELLADSDETFVSLRRTAGITRKGRSDESRHRRVLRLYVTCHLLTRDFVYRGREGRMPSTVSLRRVVQGLVDLLENDADLLIALTHQGGAKLGLAGHMVRSSILAAAVARAAGLAPRLAGRAALVVFMSRLPLARLGERWYAAPSELLSKTFDSSLKEVLKHAGRGQVSAWRLVLLYEALMASLGTTSPYGDQLVTSFEGRIVEMATTYDRIRAGLNSGNSRSEPLAPVIAIRKLAEDSGEHGSLDAGLVQVLQRLVGEVPPGSLVRTNAGIYGIVRDRPGIVEIASADGHIRGRFRKKQANKVMPLELPEGLDLAPMLGWEEEPALEDVELVFD